MARSPSVPLSLAFAALALLAAPACGSDPTTPPVVPAPAPPSPVEAAAARAPVEVAAAPVAPSPVDVAPSPPPPTPPSPERAEAFTARRPKTVVELQPWRVESSVQLPADQGPATIVTMVDLNPAVHEWLLVRIETAGLPPRSWHLENHDPSAVRVALDPAFPEGLSLHIGDRVERCALWPASGSALELGRASGQSFTITA